MNQREKQKEFLRRYLNAETVCIQKKKGEIDIEPYDGEILMERGRIKETSHTKRTTLTLLILCMLALITIVLGTAFLDKRKHIFIGTMLLLYAMGAFFAKYEGKKPQARELVLIAVLTALTVAGRAAFFMAPNFKPVAAMIIIIAVSLGSEAGFLVGCLSMLVSNFLFGQGPWTPWQMISYGLIGYIAGMLFRKKKIQKKSLCYYGFLSVIFLFGGIMNGASLIMYTIDFSWEILLSMYISGLPMDLVQAGSTVLFLWIGAKPMLEKLERVKKKYGI